MRAPGQVLGAPSVFKLVPRTPKRLVWKIILHIMTIKKKNIISIKIIVAQKTKVREHLLRVGPGLELGYQ